MADLSKVDTRSANQTRGRLTDRRAGILPERRDTRADRLQSFATMSSAQRGDGGAEALMQTLGMVREAAGDFQQYADTKFKKDEEDNAARGALDQATDKVDEEKAGRSYAYRNAVARGRTMTAWNGGLKDFRDDLRGVVEQQNQLTLEERQAEVRQHVETFYKGFAIDPDTGKLRDFLATPDSMRYLGEQMQLGRPQFEDAALQRIEERFNEEAVTHFSQNLMDQALAGQPVDLALSLAILPPTVPDEARRAAIVNTFITVSTQLRDQKRFAEGERLLTQLLSGYVDAAGRPIETIADGLAVLQGSPRAVAIPASDVAPAAAPAYNPASLKAKIRGPESGGNDAATNGMGSSASGRYQFVEGTFKQLYKRVYGATSSASRDAWANKRFDVGIQEKLMDALLVENEAALKSNGVPVNDANMYVMHVLGSGDGPKFLKAAPGTPVASILSADIVQQNPAYFGKGKTVAQAHARMASAIGTASGEGVTPDDPVAANVGFVLPENPLDPIEAEIRNPTASPLAPLLTGGLKLTPTEIVRLSEVRDGYRREARTTWNREFRDQQDHTAQSMMLRMYGQGAPLTSQDITDAAGLGEISGAHATSLFEQLRQNVNMARSYEDQQEADADRAQSKRREQQAESLVAHYTGGLYTGRDTPAQARARVLRDAGRITDPAVRSAVMAAVGEDANRIEALRAGSAPFRQTMNRVDDAETTTLTGLKAGTGGNVTHISAILRNKLDIARKRIAERIADGEEADAVFNEEMTKVAAERVRLTKPRAPAAR